MLLREKFGMCSAVPHTGRAAIMSPISGLDVPGLGLPQLSVQVRREWAPAGPKAGSSQRSPQFKNDLERKDAEFGWAWAWWSEAPFITKVRRNLDETGRQLKNTCLPV